MTLEELQESANRDLKIDDTDLGTESINIPILHNKYLQHFNKFSLLLKKSEYEQKVLRRQKWNTTQVNQTRLCTKRNHST